MFGLILNNFVDYGQIMPDAVFLPMADVRHIENTDVIYYGDNGFALDYLKSYGAYMITLTPETNSQTLHDLLKDHPGTLYCRCTPTPVSSLTSASIGILDDVVDVWVPYIHTESDVKEFYAQFPKINGKIIPAFNVDLSPIYAKLYNNFILYNYNDVSQFTKLITYVDLLKGNKMSYPTNNKGLIANYLPVDQFQPNHSEYECGAFAVSLNLRATNYNEPNTKDPLKIVSWAEAEYAKYTGSNGPANNLGLSVDAMHRILKDTQMDSSGGLHYWDLPISSGTKQSDDISRIKGAINHGYAVIATVTEQSVYDLDLDKNPYWWGPSGNHIITYAGIASDGNILCIDPANVAVGNLQKPGTVLPWPRRYDVSRLANQWATIIQFPWLPDIPNNDPLTWAPYETPKPVNETITMLYDAASKQIIFMTGNTAIYRINL